MVRGEETLGNLVIPMGQLFTYVVAPYRKGSEKVGGIDSQVSRESVKSFIINNMYCITPRGGAWRRGGVGSKEKDKS